MKFVCIFLGIQICCIRNLWLLPAQVIYIHPILSLVKSWTFCRCMAIVGCRDTDNSGMTYSSLLVHQETKRTHKILRSGKYRGCSKTYHLFMPHGNGYCHEIILIILLISKSMDSWKINCISSLCSCNKLTFPHFLIFRFLL